MIKYNYMCECCGKSFSRKKAIKGKIICKGCKREETYKKDPIKKLQHEKNRKEAFLKRYGVDNPSKLKDVKRRIAEKAIERFQDVDTKSLILEKRKATNIEKYGNASAMQNEAIKQKNREAQLLSKGYIGWQNKDLLKKAQKLAHSSAANLKRKETSERHYGVSHHFKNSSILAKQWDSYKERTGYDHPAHNPNVKHSIKGYQFEGIHFDSSWELAYYIWLRDSNKAFIYHPEYYLTYFDEANELRHYQPDFLVEGKFIEIKGDHFFNEKNEPYNHYEKAFWWSKYKALIENQVEILRFEEIKYYLRYIKEKYGKDYLRSFKKR